ncbi:TPA: type II secretion system protein [Pasteurella multocida]|nr:type II secretion system protein [Pasteurella multocida]
MKRGFTLLEMLMVLLLISSMLLVVLPNWTRVIDFIAFEQEQRKLWIFLRQLQTRVATSGQVWFLIANRDVNRQHWCLTAQLKSEYICDCFAPQYCPKTLSAQFYSSHFTGYTMLKTKHYYPNTMTRLSAIRDTLETTCFVLQTDYQKAIFSLFNVGSIKLKKEASLSACEHNKEN